MKRFCVGGKILFGILLSASQPVCAIDGYGIPGIDEVERVGALMPYTRYESEEAVCGGGAVLRTSADYDPRNIATQASGRSYVALPSKGSYAEWTAVRGGNGVTVRFTLPDATSGTDGLRGSLDFYVNGEKRKVRVYGQEKENIELSSYYAWQYYDATHTDNASDTYISGAIPCFAFDEVGFTVEGGIEKGDRIRVMSTGENGLEYGVDFLETEKTSPTAQPENSVSVADYDNNVVEAAKDAANRGKTLYIPEGNYEIGGKWTLPGGVKITGAGIFYTNILFTSSTAGGGGIVCSSGAELSNLHLNSRLNSRCNQAANYKGLEGGPDGFYAHDLWIQHFECGAWFECGGNIRVINCRLRDNIADGLNFCRGTSNSTVYNCSVRNNGDDQLAMWNHNWNCGDESNNVFCHNTIELGWRAGQLGVFGGNNHKIYNNYIRDGVLSAGIRVNTDFPGYGFQNTEEILFKNNYVVNCGTKNDIFGQNLAAVFVRSSNWQGAGEVRNVFFENTQIYCSQSDDIVTVDNVPVTNYRQATVPDYPAVDDEEEASGGVLEGISGYDLIVDGLAWAAASGGVFDGIRQGDRVVFTARIRNNSNVNIPEGVLIGLGIYIDGNLNLINNSYNGGLDAGKDIRLQVEWTATAGGHTVTAAADPMDRLPHETDESNNSRVKRFNVLEAESVVNKEYTSVTGGCDLYVTDITFKNLTRDNGTIQPGDHIVFTAVGVNAGDHATPNTKHGVQFQIDGKGWTDTHITWCDDFNGPMTVHEFHDFTANGGGSESGEGNGNNYWVAAEGSHTVTAWIDDSGNISEANEDNNKTTITLPVIPYNGVTYIENPDQPDNLDGTGGTEPAAVEITIGSTGYATFFYDKALNFRDTGGLKAYVATGIKKGVGDVQKVIIMNVTDVPANTGLLLKGGEGTYTVPFGNGGSFYTNLFMGTLTGIDIYAEEGDYRNFILYNGTNGIGFYPTDNGRLPANRAYLQVPKAQASSAKAFVFSLDGGTTAIEETTADSNGDEKTYYTLTGIRVTCPTKGIYIHNGGKVVIR